MKKIVLTGGGTAGHVYPALAVKERLGDDFEVHYIGGKGMEKDIIAKEGDITYHQISTVKLKRKLTLENLLLPIKLIKSVRQAKKALKEIKPDVIFSKGGFVAVPVAMAAKSLGIPLVSHESDLSMGLANKVILRFCDVMCTTFEKTAAVSPKCVFTGQPIRKALLKGNKKHLKFFSSLDKSMPVLLVIGGSSGAKFLNEKVQENLSRLCKNFNVIHITGKQNVDKIDHQRYFQVEYAENMGDYLDCADIVLSRAGSGAINEFLTLRKPMLLIPLSKRCSRGDQIENAKFFTSLGYADMLEEEDYDESIFNIKINNLYKKRQKYIENMKKSSNFDACDKIVGLLMKEISKK